MTEIARAAVTLVMAAGHGVTSLVLEDEFLGILEPRDIEAIRCGDLLH